MIIKPRVLIVGRVSEDGSRGKMAKLCHEGLAMAGFACRRVAEPDLNKIRDWIGFNEEGNSVVHFSKTHLTSTIDVCEQFNLPLIQAASGFPPPENVNIPYVHAPNLALGMLAMLETWKFHGNLMMKLNAKSFIAEGHQASKDSAPITAQTAAPFYGVNPKEIGSLRSDALAACFLDVPSEHHAGFAIHATKSVLPGMEVTTMTRIHGREVYLEGLKVLVAAIVEQRANLLNRVYSPQELIFG